jgi:hypothetical protein
MTNLKNQILDIIKEILKIDCNIPFFGINKTIILSKFIGKWFFFADLFIVYWNFGTVSPIPGGSQVIDNLSCTHFMLILQS